MKSALRFVLLALVLLIVAMVSALTAMRFAIHVGEVDVPNLAGKSAAESRQLTEERGLRLEIERQFYSSDVPEGKILSQVPSWGTKVRRGWTVRVAQSLGRQRVSIPNVIGETERAAGINIRRRGIELGAVARMQMPGTPSDQVLSQSPPPNASGVATPKMNLLVAQPAQPQAFVMPDFVGKPLADARLALQEAGLRVGTVTVVPPSPSGQFSPASLIVSQKPAAGEKVDAGAAIDFQLHFQNP